MSVLRRRLGRCLAGLLAGGAMAVPLGPTTTQRAVDRMNASSMRGVPSVPAAPAPRGDMVWVPDRFVPAPGAPTGVFEPGHWVVHTPEGGRIAPPPPVPGAVQGP
jgi:hypothetical protein